MPKFKFSSIAEFAAMDGHGIYVWSCTVIALVILTALLLHPLWLQKNQKRKIAQQLALKQYQQQRHKRPTVTE
ncbi:heme exporter protein CcmD [Gilvimarinus sp. DA14]|uniref:heme exporter protein CcmD n=1 Tax=Gilvimarinus sp. DA14 TaxID=2956798 RepID=UPI0020B8A5A4|nr:heme exporter protein CcmD [Gilvimarinus sp. DA14]UTF60695.1 heme exporter protein CcmD [Gilvimarinus sp. DA14]